MSVFRKIFVRMGAPASTGLALSTAAVPRAGQEHCARLVNHLLHIYDSYWSIVYICRISGNSLLGYLFYFV